MSLFRIFFVSHSAKSKNSVCTPVDAFHLLHFIGLTNAPGRSRFVLHDLIAQRVLVASVILKMRRKLLRRTKAMIVSWNGSGHGIMRLCSGLVSGQNKILSDFSSCLLMAYVIICRLS